MSNNDIEWIHFIKQDLEVSDQEYALARQIDLEDLEETVENIKDIAVLCNIEFEKVNNEYTGYLLIDKKTI